MKLNFIDKPAFNLIRKTDSVKLLIEFQNDVKKLAVSFQSSYTALQWLFPMPHRIGVFVDLSCNTTSNYIMQLSTTVGIFNGSYVWLFWSELIEATDYLNKTQIYLGSDITLSVPSSNLNSSDVLFFDIFKAYPQNNLNVTNIGFWNKDVGFVQRILIKRKPNFEGIRLPVSMVLTDLEVDMNRLDELITDKSYHPDLDIINRYFYVINDVLRLICNYTWDIVMTNAWGYLQADGHFNGMIGAIENKTTYFALGPAEPSAERQTVVDFLIPFHGFRTCYIFRQPKVIGTYRALASPLDKLVWAYLFLIMTVATITCKIISTYGDSLDNRNEKSYIAGVVLTIGAICQQGLVIDQRRISERMFGTFILFLGLMILAYYNAAVMNSLLSPSPSKIKSIEQLVNSPLELGMLNMPYLLSRVNDKNPLTASAYAKMMKQKPPGIVNSLLVGVERIKSSRYAFYAEDNTLYSEIDQTFRDGEKCDLSELEMLRPYPVASSIRKGSPFKEFMNRNILLIMERGILYRENKMWYSQRPTCHGSQDLLHVSLEAVSIAFWILLTGFVCSSVIFTIEITIEKLSFLYFKKRFRHHLKRKVAFQ